jgi:outer membrane protein assembly factor BamA
MKFIKTNFYSEIEKTFTAILFLLFASLHADTLQKPPEQPAQDSGITKETTEDSFPAKIKKIYINGNRVSRSDIIRMYVGLDTGMTWDSVTAASGKRRLLNTNLFSKVNIVALRKAAGIDVYIMVTELFYLYPEGGGDYILGKYGDTTGHRYPLWYRLRLGLSIQNFRGCFETFSVRTSIWDDRALSLSWSKPFVPSPYSAGISAGIRDFPEINFPRRRFIVNGRISAGRNVFDNSRVWLSLSPTYSRIDSILSWHKSTYVKDPSTIKHLKEVYSAVGWSTDRRDRSYDPVKGWLISADALTNVLYAGDYNKYIQFDADLRLYHPGFLYADHFAYRLQTVVRPNDAGGYRGLYIGGDGSIRGFYQGQVGLPSRENNAAFMNNYVVGTAEYRFPIWTMPSFDVWLLSDYSDMLKGFYMRLDGGAFVDAGHIWHDLAHPFVEQDNGVGFGAGLRIMMPTIRRSVCIDVAWAGTPRQRPPHITFLNEPNYSLYLDMYF